MARLKKLNHVQLSDLLNMENNGYYAVQRGSYSPEWFNGKISGHMYILEKRMTEHALQEVNGYDNTLVTECCSRYAPEQKHQAVFIADKCFAAYVNRG